MIWSSSRPDNVKAMCGAIGLLPQCESPVASPSSTRSTASSTRRSSPDVLPTNRFSKDNTSRKQPRSDSPSKLAAKPNERPFRLNLANDLLSSALSAMSIEPSASCGSQSRASQPRLSAHSNHSPSSTPPESRSETAPVTPPSRQSQESSLVDSLADNYPFLEAVWARDTLGLSAADYKCALSICMCR